MSREMKDSASREQSRAGMYSAEAQPILERKLKQSGIEWIGEIPKEWKVKRAKHLFAQRNSKGNESAVLLSATQKQGMMPQSLLHMQGTGLSPCEVLERKLKLFINFVYRDQIKGASASFCHYTPTHRKWKRMRK